MTESLDEYCPSNGYKKPESKIVKAEISEREKFETFLFKLWNKAQVLQFDDFKGWANGEGYVVSRFEEPPFKR